MLHLLTYSMTALPPSSRAESWAAVPSLRVRGGSCTTVLQQGQPVPLHCQPDPQWMEELDGGTRRLILLPDCIDSEKN